MKAEWKDETSYRAGDKDRIPRCWAIMLGGERFAVHRLHGIDGLWFVSGGGGALRNIQLDATEAEAAKREALRMIADRYFEVSRAAENTLLEAPR